MSRSFKIFHRSLQSTLTSKYLYVIPIGGIAVTIFLAMNAYVYPGDTGLPPAESSIRYSIIMANLLGCFMAAFIGSNTPLSKGYELELTKPVSRWQYILCQMLGEIILPLLTAAAILLGTHTYLLYKGEPFHTEIILIIGLLSISIVALFGFVKVFSFIVDQFLALACSILVVFLSTQGFRGALLKMGYIRPILYIIPDLQTSTLISLNLLLGMDVEWKYFLAVFLYAVFSILAVSYLFQKKDL